MKGQQILLDRLGDVPAAALLVDGKLEDLLIDPGTALDGKGNYSLGIKEHIIFPEIDYDKIDRIKGMNITIVTTARTDEEGKELLKLLGMPFKN